MDKVQESSKSEVSIGCVVGQTVTNFPLDLIPGQVMWDVWWVKWY
jgi:hypothetical protein